MRFRYSNPPVLVASLTVAGKVELATRDETNTGTDATRAVTPDGLSVFKGTNNITTVGTLISGNANGIVSPATLTAPGVVELATVSETNTGTDATRAVTPDGLDGFTGSAQIVTVGTLVSGNADGIVSAADLTTPGIVELATGTETNTGTDATRAVTPDGLDDWTGSGQITTVGTLASNLFTAAGIGVVVGHNAQISFGAVPELQVLGTDTGGSSLGFGRWEDNDSGPDVRFLKSRAAAIGDLKIVEDGDTLGRFRFQGDDGGDYNTTAAEISAAVDGSPSLNDIPGKIIFSTRTAGGSLTEKVWIDNAGNVEIVGGDLTIGAGDILFDNAQSIKIEDNVATSRKVFNLNSSNDFNIGQVDTGWGRLLLLRAGTKQIFYVNGASGSFTEAMKIQDTARIGVGISSAPGALFHIDQKSSSAGIPVLLLDQADVDKPAIKFIGSSLDASAARTLVDAADFTTPGAIAAWVMVEVQDDQSTNPIADGIYYMPLHAIPTA